jgi:Na+(H+)/acetate symporter ActP
MSGGASWEQIIFIVTLIVTISVASFIVAWRIQVHLAKERHATRTAFDQRTQGLDDKVDLLMGGIEKRLNAIEVFNAGTLVVLEHLKEFRDEVKKQYDELRIERKEDMQGLHRRLDALHNTARLIESDVAPPRIKE